MNQGNNENKQYPYTGAVVNGFVMLLVMLAIVAVPVALGVSLARVGGDDTALAISTPIAFVLLALISAGLFTQQPNEARVAIFFGKYKGTVTRTGFHWINPFIVKKKVSLRLDNMDIDPIKVNDKVGNPVMIGMVLVWKITDTYRVCFDIDTNIYNFVRIQSDAALREVTGHYAYDNTGTTDEEITLREGGAEINELLERKINERLAMAGITVVEARINYLAYAPEIAAVMLRRQQAAAVISAREKIVEGAVSMVKMAVSQIEREQVVTFDPQTKAAMVSNLLVVLCSDEPAQPVLNAGNS